MVTYYNPDHHNRRSIRLTGYDYSQTGTYFITICTQDKECLFGELEDNKMVFNHTGRIVKDSWLWLSTQYEYIELDEYVVMPNHLHGILLITDNSMKSTHGIGSSRGGSRTAPTNARRKSVGRLVGAFKTISTKHINEIRNTPGLKLWQRNYYEHIIRNDGDLHRVRQYIIDNPMNWNHDPENPYNFNTEDS
ncbi:MAG: transposase [Candidatus Latescibacteria bacterium]|nr:transposase [Candidatus Latescibacterota bacterium]